jgi:hypothetical protein
VKPSRARPWIACSCEPGIPRHLVRNCRAEIADLKIEQREGKLLKVTSLALAAVRSGRTRARQLRGKGATGAVRKPIAGPHAASRQ